jgi:hypothetical protein
MKRLAIHFGVALVTTSLGVLCVLCVQGLATDTVAKVLFSTSGTPEPENRFHSSSHIVDEDQANPSSVESTQPVRPVKSECFTIPFHFILIRDADYSSNVKDVEVFLDETAFNEQNLKNLFLHLSNRYPQPAMLLIHVKTDWKQLPLPSDCPGTGASNLPLDPDRNDSYKAFYRRSTVDGTEYFKYNPELNSDDYRTVIIHDRR